MDGMRWFLLLIGVLVIAGVYFYSRRERANREKQSETSERIQQRVEPSIDGANLDDEPIDEAFEPVVEIAKDSAEPETDLPESPVAQKQKIVTLRVIARNQGTFAGDELALSLRGIGLRHGKFGIFHRYDGIDEDRVIFSAASLVEPGSFDLKNLKQQRIPGISLFMILPGPIDGAQAFDLMMVAARALGQSLNAELLDESGSTLSIQRERYLREEIVQYQTANLVA